MWLHEGGQGALTAGSSTLAPVDTSATTIYLDTTIPINSPTYLLWYEGLLSLNEIGYSIKLAQTGPDLVNCLFWFPSLSALDLVPLNGPRLATRLANFFGKIIISLYMYVWNKHAGEIVTLWWVHGRPNLLVHKLIGLWSNWLCSFKCLVFFCGRRIETKWGWTEVFCLVLPGSYWGHDEWGEVCTWGCQLQTLPSASSTFLHQITQLPLLALVLFSSCWLLALIVVFSSHENSYIKICQLFMVFISSVSSVDILGITQIFNDCLILQNFCIWFFSSLCGGPSC